MKRNVTEEYYCFKCKRIEKVKDASIVFKTGFKRLEFQDYRAGYCALSPNNQHD
ncbi:MULTISPECIES: hypothetical protein [unclassified Paenibacillus]|uniref:hypothetical protein n=1 Tax=unclassified Paenibacillus TaxID=185978 RepID=UPI001AE471F2|nr:MULTISPECIES: hypothetical protein [unclassified Paenibacillus]MBP1157443.1 hypothetical protein [Paenibacillus sp. PvP091]MBP1171819.1 hypothetical protein [Paenibacillus sp. PvR098]MBP2438200.1 hypothetical protein [Paenibacillus sp. PvP052]